AFEPDAREGAPLNAGQREFLRWIFVPALVTPVPSTTGTRELYLTRSPECSSMLRPRTETLQSWAFGDSFEVVKSRAVPAVTLAETLTTQGIDRLDWLKCDTQGLDFQIYCSLPVAWRHRLLVADFEPGLIDAYEGEDRLPTVMAGMQAEPFLVAGLEVRHMARRGPVSWSPAQRRWLRRLVPGAPAWVNLRYLRDVQREPDLLDRRAYLLAWTFASLGGLHDHALEVATKGGREHGGELFAAMAADSERRLRQAMIRGLPGWLGRRRWSR
ncbi:MAG: hypothetical protein A3G75_14790, partial [Verrucomicrobia bacterium RIFCSPLOWO2_12_FULL_64_8]